MGEIDEFLAAVPPRQRQADLALLNGDVGDEHSRASVGGDAPAPIELRVTLIFRREDGEWKEVHRHADPIPALIRHTSIAITG